MDTLEYAGVDNLEVMAKATNYHNFLSSVIRSHIRKGDKVVDFGAGLGTFASIGRTIGADVLCVEIDERLRCQLQSKGFSVARELTPADAERFDALYAFDVAEHIENDTDVMSDWLRALKPGGMALVYVPAFPLLFSDMDRRIGHFRRYRKNSLRTKLESVGFEIKQIGYVDCLGFAGSLTYKWLSRSGGQIKWKTVSFYDGTVFPVSRKLDRIFSHVVGKNLLAVAQKPLGRQIHTP